MDGIRAAWNRLAASPRGLALAAAVGFFAVVGGVGFAIAVNGVRQPIDAAATSSAVETVDASPLEDASPSLAPTTTASPVRTATASPMPSPTPPPVSSPTAAPTPTLPPPPSPGTCDTFAFSPGAITVGSLAELEKGIVGTWVGCVTTPWVPPYWVTITFRADGTYSGFAEETAGEPTFTDGLPAFYYGTDDDSPEKLYELNELQDDLEGIGQIDIVFRPGTTNRGDLRNIRLMDNHLEFEFFHVGFYGPLTYQLFRVTPPE